MDAQHAPSPEVEAELFGHVFQPSAASDGCAVCNGEPSALEVVFVYSHGFVRAGRWGLACEVCGYGERSHAVTDCAAD